MVCLVVYNQPEGNRGRDEFGTSYLLGRQNTKDKRQKTKNKRQKIKDIKMYINQILTYLVWPVFIIASWFIIKAFIILYEKKFPDEDGSL